VKGAALSPEDLIWTFLEPRPALHFTDLRLKPLSFQASMDHNWVPGIVATNLQSSNRCAVLECGIIRDRRC
jgi:hypothetical protein